VADGSGNRIVVVARKLRIRYSTLQLGGVVKLAIVELSLTAERAGSSYLTGKLLFAKQAKKFLVFLEAALKLS